MPFHDGKVGQAGGKVLIALGSPPPEKIDGWTRFSSDRDTLRENPVNVLRHKTVRVTADPELGVLATCFEPIHSEDQWWGNKNLKFTFSQKDDGPFQPNEAIQATIQALVEDADCGVFQPKTIKFQVPAEATCYRAAT